MSLNLKAKIYNDETAARKHLEKLNWPDGPICPHCGTVDEATKLRGKSTRPGVYKCKAKGCQKPFSVTVGTVFERSKIPLTKWLLATQLLTSSKKGMSSHQLSRMLDVTYKTAWFMAHRIREAMKDANPSPLGGEGKVIEADETYTGRKERTTVAPGFQHKRTVVGLVERGGHSRMFHIEKATKKTVHEILHTTADRASELHTDESNLYKRDTGFRSHHTVNHGHEEYVRKEGGRTITTNTIEGVFSVFKRGMIGTYQHCGEQHLQRYLAEFDFRYNNRSALGIDDAMRAEQALKQISGKRLTYRRIDQA